MFLSKGLSKEKYKNIEKRKKKQMEGCANLKNKRRINERLSTHAEASARVSTTDRGDLSSMVAPKAADRTPVVRLHLNFLL